MPASTNIRAKKYVFIIIVVSLVQPIIQRRRALDWGLAGSHNNFVMEEVCPHTERSARCAINLCMAGVCFGRARL